METKGLGKLPLCIFVFPGESKRKSQKPIFHVQPDLETVS